MSLTRERFATSVLCVAMLVLGMMFVAAPSAWAGCVIYPGTNRITITVGSASGSIPSTPAGLVGECDEVRGDPNPRVDEDVTVEPGTGCGFPCFVVAWDGFTTDPVTVTLTVYVKNEPTTVSHTIPGGTSGSFCINAGTSCP